MKEYYIKLDNGMAIPVSRKVYNEYYRSKWREEKVIRHIMTGLHRLIL
jgi:hypothetical protein